MAESSRYMQTPIKKESLLEIEHNLKNLRKYQTDSFIQVQVDDDLISQINNNILNDNMLQTIEDTSLHNMTEKQIT